MSIGSSVDPHKRHAGVGDDFILQLGPHPRIERFWLGFSSVTDKSVPVLAEMPSLIDVNLPDTVSDSGKNMLAAKISSREK